MHITAATQLDEALSLNAHIVLDCHASWCGPCKRLAPVLNELALAHPHVQLLMLDVDDADQDLLTRLGVSALPTVIFYKQGVETEKVVGFSVDKVRNAFIHTAV